MYVIKTKNNKYILTIVFYKDMLKSIKRIYNYIKNATCDLCYLNQLASCLI